MNGNGEGTPNPLNPNPLDANPSEPMEEVNEVAVEETRGQHVEEPVVEEVAVEEQVVEEPVAEAVVAEEPVAEPVATKKPKKTGLIIAIILILAAIIAGAASAIVLLDPFGWMGNKDAVPAAIAKLINRETPSIVAMDGSVKMSVDSPDSAFSALELKFKSAIDSNTSENYAKASIVATLMDGSEFNFDADEIKTSDGDLYLRLSGITNALSRFEPVATDCNVEIEADCMMPSSDDSVLEFLGVFEVIDDEWIRIPSSDFSNVTDVAQIDMPTQCIIDAAGNLSEYGSDFSKLYKDNSFINYTTDGLKIAPKKDTLYQLKFDSDKLAGFINSMTNSGFMNEMLACMGGMAINGNVSGADLEGIIAVLPEIYVEIDDDNNFTRVYLTIENSELGITATADLLLSYPTDIVVEEPEVYIEVNEVLSKLLTMFYGENVYFEAE